MSVMINAERTAQEMTDGVVRELRVQDARVRTEGKDERTVIQMGKGNESRNKNHQCPGKERTIP